MIRLSDGKTYPLTEANSAEGESYQFMEPQQSLAGI